MIVQNPCEGFIVSARCIHKNLRKGEDIESYYPGVTSHTKFARSPGIYAYAILRADRQNRSSNRCLRGETLLITGLWISVTEYRYVLVVSYDRCVSDEF